MAEKQVRTRIINKHGALADWASSELVLKEGEIALAYIETTKTKPGTQNGTYTVPTYLMKVGNGTDKFADLEWLAAPASDVYAWAKKANLELADIPMADVTNTLKGTFYTEDEVDSLLADKSDADHTHTITASASDDDIVVLTGTSGTNSVSYSASHATSGVTAGKDYNKFTVNATGHVIAASKETTIAGLGVTDVYTKTEADALLADKSDTGHTHNYAGSTSVGGPANSVANSLSIQLNGGTAKTFNGSANVNIDITPSAVGAAPATHTHTKSQITDFAHNHNDLYYTETEMDSKLAGKSDTGHTHDDRYYTETEVDQKISAAVSSALKYKGSKDTTSLLPTTGNVVGDVWNISTACAATGTLPKVNAGDNVAWNGTSWDVLAGTVDLSSYAVKNDVDAALAEKSDIGHEHNYAGSSSPGGAANSVKAALTFSTAGDGATNGTTYNGSTARKISYNSVGAAPTTHTHTKSQITDFEHNHDDRYYTESESDAKFAPVVHTHETTIATSTGTNELTLAHGGKYAITAGGESFVFTMPSDNNTHYESKNVVGSSTATSNTTTALTNGNVYLNSVENGAVTSTHKISGSGAATVTTDASGNIVITSTDTNTKVTTVGNHYTPAADASKELSADASSTTAATWNTTSLVTGVNLQRDAAGHVTGVTVDSIKMPANPDTHYTTGIRAGASGTNANTSLYNPYIKVTDKSGSTVTYREQIKLTEASTTAGINIQSDANGVIKFEALPATNSAGETMTYIWDCGGPTDE